MSHWNPSSGWKQSRGRHAGDPADYGTDQASTGQASTGQAGSGQAGSGEQAGSGYQEYPGYEAGSAAPSGPAYPDDPAYPGDPAYPDDPAYPGDPAYPDDPAYPGDPAYPDDPAYPGVAGYDAGEAGGYVPGYETGPGTDGTWDQPWAGAQPDQGTGPPAEAANPYPEPPISPAPIWEDPLPRTQSPPPIWEDQQPPKAYLRQQPEPPGPPGGRTRKIVITVLVLVLVAAAGSAVALKLRSHGKVTAAASGGATASQPPSPTSPASQPQPSQTAPTPVRTTARPSPSAGPPDGHLTVAVAPAAAREPAAASVASFLTSYFTAINTHDYQRFRLLLGQQMQQVETAQRFAAGFRSTTDSGAVLIGLSPVTGGRLAAIVQFTSHQSPADSPDHLACTHWTITLYLQPSGTGYLLGAPPPGYQASHQSC